MTIRAPRRTAAALMLVAATPMLSQCGRPAPEPPAAVRPATPEAPPPAPSTPVPAALTRSTVIAELDRAASAYAAGRPYAAGDSLAGRTVTLSLPFGCAGPQPVGATTGEGRAQWAWSKDRSTIRLTVTPADWTRSPLVLAPGAEPAWDGVEGFWIERPWLQEDACPAGKPVTPEPVVGKVGAVPVLPVTPAASPMTAGLAVILGNEGSRLGRRDGRAYSFTIRATGDTPPSPPQDGYRLVLEGRVGTFPDGRALRCMSQSPDRRPTCVIAVQLDVVAFDTATGTRLSEWRPT